MSIRLLAPISGFLLVVSATVGADIPKPPEGKLTDPKLKYFKNLSNAKDRVDRLRNGNASVPLEDPDVPAVLVENREALKLVAQFYAYSLATPPYNGIDEKSLTPFVGEKSIPVLVAEFERYCILPALPANGGRVTVAQERYADEWAKAAGTELKFVFDNESKPVVLVNAVRMMSIIAKMPAPSIHEPLLAIAANTKASDAVRLYAFRGLSNLLEQSASDDSSKHVLRDVTKLGEIAKALSDYVTQKRTYRDDREKAVIEYVRREAVIALSKFKDASIRKLSKEVIFRPGWALMRVLADPNIAPPATLQERVEATIGLCQMKVDAELNYDIEAGFFQPMMVEFSRAASIDSRPPIEGKKDDGTPVALEKPVALLPWKVTSARLSYALASWRETTKGLPADKKGPVATFAAAGIEMLNPIEAGGAIAASGSQRLQNWWTENPPASYKAMQPMLMFNNDPTTLLPIQVTATITTPKKDPKADPAKTDPKTEVPVKK